MEEKLRYPEVDEYIRSIIKRESGFLKELENYAAVHHVPIVPPETAAFLKVLVRAHKPLRILEAGTAIGYSACIMAGCLQDAGIIDTIEIDEPTAERAEKNIRTMGLGKAVRIIRGDALEVMQCLSTPYDMIFLDASKGQYMEYFQESMRLLKTGGLLVSDNILYKGLVAQKGPVPHKHRTITLKLREYLDMLCRDERLETSVIPIGDGLAVSIRIE